MFLQPYYSIQDGSISVSAEQASHFAKGMAEDFNPIHDPDAKRFCVPGDLLFSLVLNQCGLSKQMAFSFDGMVGRDQLLSLPVAETGTSAVTDRAGKSYITIERGGETTQDKRLIESLVRQYVLFSGQNFPHVMVPLMESQQVMINPERPLVMYEHMTLSLERFDLQQPVLRQAGAELEVNGKRGVATLHFEVTDNNVVVGTGSKRLLLSGLRPYQQEAVEGLIQAYQDRRTDFEQLQQAA